MFGRLSDFESGLLDDFVRMQQEMEELFRAGPTPSGIRASGRGAYPPINIGATEERVDVYLFAAGIDPASLDITMQQNLLTVTGQRQLSAEEGVDYYRRERYQGDFRRVMTLPEDVDPEKVDAVYRDGVLHITVERTEAAKTRQIQVN
mgnify:FL=1|jgi:HSP20 family protein